jgi:hypothetical protein
MKRLFLLLGFLNCTLACASQTQHRTHCGILTHFVNDKKVLFYLSFDLSLKDTITIIDSTGKLASCHSFLAQNSVVVITDDRKNLIINPRIRTDVLKWKNHLLIYKLEITKKYYKIYFFSKTTNTVGSAQYNVKGKKIVSAVYDIGIL